jgi:hypothetical protein
MIQFNPARQRRSLSLGDRCDEHERIRRNVLTSFRFVHNADIHLDSPLKGLADHEGRAAERIRTATREAV